MDRQKPSYEELQSKVKELQRNARKAGQAQEALRIQNAYLELLFESAPEAIVMADKDHRITRINPQFARMFGYAPHEAFGKRVDDLITGKDSREEAVQVTDQVGRGEKIRMEGIRYTKNGSPVYVDLMATPVWAGKEQIATYASYRDITEKKQAEKKLRDSERSHRELIEGSRDGYAMADLSGRIVETNTAFQELLGFTEEELVDKTYEDLSPRKWHALETDVLKEQVFKRGYSNVYEKEYVKKNGTVFPVEMRTYLRKDERGNPTGIWTLARDVTDRKMAEEALKESHSTLLTVLDSIDATIYVADMQTYEILFMNEYMKNAFGHDLVGKTCFEVFRGESQPCCHCTNPQLVDSEGRPTGLCVWESQTPISQRWYMNYDRAIKWVDGRLVRLQVAIDITRSKEEELALKSEKGYLDALHETAIGLVSRHEAEEVLEAIVEKAARLVGTPHGFICLYDQARGDLTLNIGLGKFREMVGFRLKPGEGVAGKVLLSGKPVIVDDYRSWVNRAPDSRFDELSVVVGFPLRSENQVNGVIGLGYFSESRKFTPVEITALSRFAEIASIALDNALLYSKLRNELQERKKAEAEQRKLESQLQRAMRMQAIGTLAGGIAHDFNNLLMGIQGRTSLMLLDTLSSHPYFEHLKGIESYVRDAAALTRQLLGFARGGKYEVRPTDLNELVQRSAHMFGRTRKEIKIHAKVQEGIWTAEVDQTQIEQVLLNLYVNAWQAMPGGGDLHIETKNVFLGEKEVQPYDVKPGPYVKVTVTDTGVGMDERTQQRIFEPFFTTKELGRGTGLGLASAYGIIKNHSGIIEVESKKGAGTSFHVYLPVSHKEVTKDSAVPKEVRKGSEGVLLVDDEEMVRTVLRGMMEELGYRVWVAESGEEAMELMRKHGHEIQIVLLDMIMPGLSGGEVFDRLKRLKPSVKVILSSGYSLHGEAAKIMGRGCDGFIQKPFGIKDLSAKMREILEDAAD